MHKFRVIADDDKYLLEVYDPYLWIIPYWSKIGTYIPYFTELRFDTIEDAEKAAIKFSNSKSVDIVKEFSIP